MKVNKKFKRIISFSLSMLLATMSPGISELAHTVPVSKAFTAEETIDEEIFLTEKDIKDTTLLSVLRVIANYTKARLDDLSLPELTGNENLLSKEYEAYQTDSFTFGDLKAYNGPINLTNYADKITSIEGLGYARGAISIDIGACTNITEIPAEEFGKCSMSTFIMSNNITKIGNSAFKQCKNLSEIKITGEKYDNTKTYTDLKYVKTIGEYAFENCKKINNVTLYNGTPELSIGIGAFINCVALDVIEIPIKKASHLGESSFAGCSSLKRIKLMDELDYLPANIFSNTCIQEVLIYGKTYSGDNYFPSGLTYIGKNAFQDSTLDVLDFTKSTNMEYIGEYAFASAYINSLKLPDGLKRIDSLAFNVTYTFSLDIPNSVTTIKEKAFRDAAIGSISISSNVTTIEKETFYGCSLSSVVFKNTTTNPSKLSTIGNYAFKNCKILNSINLDNSGSLVSSLTTIGDEAFSGCISLKNTDFLYKATKLKTIGKKAFASCCTYNKEKNDDGTYDKTAYGEWEYTGLTTINLPNSVETIGEECFTENYALVDVNLGSGITSIPKRAFFVADKSHSVLQRVIVSSNLRSINDEAFRNNQRLRTIGSTKNGVISVTPGVATFPNTLTSIGSSVFANCGYKHSLNNLYKNGVSIKGKAYEFDDADIHTEPTEGCIPYLVYEEGETDFKLVYLDIEKAHAKITPPGTILPPNTPPYSVIYLFAQKMWVNSSVTSTATEYAETLELGKAEYGYGNYITGAKKEYTTDQLSSTPINNAKEVYMLTESKKGTALNFYIYTGLTNVILPTSLIDTAEGNALGNGIFQDCISLETVQMSTGIKNLPNNTFSGCGDSVLSWKTKSTIDYTYHGLKSVTGLGRIVTIGDNCFYNCYNYNLEQSTDGGEISNSLKSIGSNAYYNCRSITSVVFHSALQSIGESAFKNCAELAPDAIKTYENNNGTERKYSYKKVLDPKNANGKGLTEVDFTYANKLSSIGKEAFAYTAIKTINLPTAKYTTVPASLFAGCSLLNIVTVPSNVTSVGQYAFKDCEKLNTLNMPVSAVIDDEILYGNTPYVMSNLQLKNYLTDKISVPIDNDYVLPIKAFNPTTRTGSYKVTVYDGKEDTTGTVIYEDGASIVGDSFDDILDVEIEYGTASKSDVIRLVGGSSGKKDLRVKIEINSAFTILCGDAGSVINSQSFIYNIDVTEIPATDINVTETSGQNKCTFITETDASGNTVNQLYYTKGQVANLKAAITPANTTEQCVWTVQNSEIASISDESFENGAGTAKLTANATGNTKVTVTCGSISEDIYVYVKVPFKTLYATTESSSSTDYQASFDLPLEENGEKTTEQITLKSTYNTSSYTEEEWTDYADTIVYKSSDTNILKVSSEGLITTVNKGQATVTVQALASHKTITFTINVVDINDYNPLNGNKISSIEGGDSVYINSSIALKAVIDPVKARNKVKWSVKGDASIDEHGILTAGENPGKVTVTATMLDANDKVTSIKLNKTINVLKGADSILLTDAVKDINLFVDQQYTLNKSVNPSIPGYYLEPDNSTDTVEILSSDDKIVSCSVVGTKLIITGVGQGYAFVTLKSSSGATKNLYVKVTAPISSITLPEKVNIERNATRTLKPVIEPENSSEKYTWSSSNESVATVNENGEVKALKIGTSKITVTSSKGVSCVCDVNVKVTATAIGLSEEVEDFKVNIEESVTLYRNPADEKPGYIMTPADATDNINCTSADTDVATCTIENNKIIITGVSTGSTKISIFTENRVATSFMIEVTEHITSITLPEAITMEAGTATKLNTVTIPKESSDEISWKSSSTKVAKVDDNGNVTAVAPGTATITASTDNKVTAACTITVKISTTAINLTSATNNVFMFTGESLSLTKTTKDTAKGYNLVPSSSTETVTATSSNGGVVTCNTQGTRITLTATGQGSATITLATPSGIQAAFAVNVTTAITAITLPKSAELIRGQALTLTPQITPADSTETYTYKSSKESVATVNSNGIVTGINKGTARITVTTSKGKSSSCDVTVTAPVTKLTLRTHANQKTAYVTVGSKVEIGCACSPYDTTDTMSYKSANLSIASVSGSGTSATVQGHKAGTTKIKVTSSSGKSTEIKVVVVKKAISAKSMKLTGYKTKYLKPGSTLQLTASLTSKKSTDTVRWSSSNSNIATIDSYGLISAKNNGECRITATASSGISTSFTLVVSNKKITAAKKVKISGKKTVKVGKTVTLKAVLTPKKTTDKVDWSSSNTKVATVSSTGIVKGNKKGKCKITATATSGKKATVTIKVK